MSGRCDIDFGDETDGLTGCPGALAEEGLGPARRAQGEFLARPAPGRCRAAVTVAATAAAASCYPPQPRVTAAPRVRYSQRLLEHTKYHHHA
jgi:hypothetical protein